MDPFNRIAGYKNEKKSLQELGLLFRRHGELTGMGVRLPHGLLISGEPGVGKTVMAEALIADAGVRCVRVSAGDVTDEDMLSPYLESKFAEAAETAPAIVFMDELDKLVGGADRFSSGYLNLANTRKLLQTMNDHRDDGVMVIATVNDLNMISTALKRSGRFDRILEIGLPSSEDRREIIRYYLTGKSVKGRVDVELFTKMSAGMSGADIECILNEAGIHALLEKRAGIRQKDIDFAVEQKLFHGTPRDRAMDDKKKEPIAVHEAGHLVAGLLIDPDNVVSASILPQGASEGHVGMARECDTLFTLSRIEDRMVMSLAGRASEKVFFPNDVYLGSGDDIQRALDLAERLVMEEGVFGFGCCLSSSQSGPFEHICEDKLKRIDEQVSALVDKCYRRAVAMIEKHRSMVAFFARVLAENYSLTHDEILRLYRAQIPAEAGGGVDAVEPERPKTEKKEPQTRPEEKEIA